MNKKILALLVIVLALGLLAACNRGGTQDPPPATPEPAPTQEPAATPEPAEADDEPYEPYDAYQPSEYWQGEVSRIIMTYVTMGIIPPDLEDVAAAINEITIPRIGVEVEFKPVSIAETFTMYSTWLATGEVMDLMLIGLQPLSPYVTMGMLNPLDDLIAQHAPGIVQLQNEFLMHEGAEFDDQAFGVRVGGSGYGQGGTYMIRQSSLEAAGLSFENRQHVTLQELSEIFTAVHAAQPDIIPAGIVANTFPFRFFHAIDGLGCSVASGVLMGTDSTTLVNMFETPEYYEFLQTVRQWYLNGYLLRDAAVTDQDPVSLLVAGRTAGMFGDIQNFLRAEMEERTGEPAVQLVLTPTYRAASAGAAANIYWTIPVTAQEPEAAMRFLDMMFNDVEVVNLLQWGIEDRHWVWLDQSINLIDFPYGIDSMTSPFYNPLGLYGMHRDVFIRSEYMAMENILVYDAQARANPTQGVGFSFDNMAVAMQIAAVQAVIDEFRPALETGTADPTTTLPTFLERLRAAGIEELIAEKQAQFDAWRAAR